MAIAMWHSKTVHTHSEKLYTPLRYPELQRGVHSGIDAGHQGQGAQTELVDVEFVMVVTCIIAKP